MRLTKEREAELRDRVKNHNNYTPCYECGSLYDHTDIKDLLSEIDYLRDSFIDIAVALEADKKERVRLREELDALRWARYRKIRGEK